MKISWEKAKCM